MAILRVSDGEFAICYDGTDQVFEGGFKTEKEALQRFENMRPVDKMLVSGRGPYLATDVEFLKGTENGRQFQKKPDQGEFYRREAEKRGQNVKGKKYISQLARFPGDPEAFVSGRGDVQKVLEQRGWGSDGSVKVKARTSDQEPAKPIAVADDIVDRETAKEIGANKVTPKQRRDVREKVRNRLKGSKK